MARTSIKQTSTACRQASNPPRVAFDTIRACTPGAKSPRYASGSSKGAFKALMLRVMLGQL